MRFFTCGATLLNAPYGFAAGDTNLRRYVGNGATIGIDPSGLDDKTKPKSDDFDYEYGTEKDGKIVKIKIAYSRKSGVWVSGMEGKVALYADSNAVLHRNGKRDTGDAGNVVAVHGDEDFVKSVQFIQFEKITFAAKAKGAKAYNPVTIDVQHQHDSGAVIKPDQWIADTESVKESSLLMSNRVHKNGEEIDAKAKGQGFTYFFDSAMTPKVLLKDAEDKIAKDPAWKDAAIAVVGEYIVLVIRDKELVGTVVYTRTISTENRKAITSEVKSYRGTSDAGEIGPKTWEQILKVIENDYPKQTDVDLPKLKAKVVK